MIENSFAQKLAQTTSAYSIRGMRQPVGGASFPRSLLLVQRKSATARALGRLLKNYYHNVFVANSPEAAEQLLGGQDAELTHVVCGEDFGPGRPLGHDLIATWRHRYPGIQIAVLATGAENIPAHLCGIDGVYRKPAPLSHLFTLLGIQGAGALASPPSDHSPPLH